MDEKPQKPIRYNFYFNASAELLKRAKELRQNQTPTEELLWNRIKDRVNHRFKWRRQHPAHKFILDFYCPKAKLAIEIDGDSHSSKGDKFYDKDRDLIMEEFGVKTIRFTTVDIYNRLDEVELEIKREVYDRLGLVYKET